jgi:FkbM family methyltransferase
MAFKSFLKGLFRRFGYDIVRYADVPGRSFPVLPYLVRDQLKKKSGLFFVQVGANDGFLDDPLRSLIIEHRLPGLLIEPLPDLFDKLRLNYKDQSQLLYENIAISAAEGTIAMYRVKSDAAVPQDWHGLASFSRQHIKAENIPDEYIERCIVRTAPLRLLLVRNHIRDISLLQVDTEGYDGEIVCSALKSGILPNIINYEHVHLSSAMRLKCKQLLAKNGYLFNEIGKDTLAIQQSQI